MEFYKTKLFDGEVNVMFTGPNYFFFNAFYGIICIAQRDEGTSLANCDRQENWKQKFTLYSGHKNGAIEKEAFALAKRIIRKHEQRYVKQNVSFKEVITDLDKAAVNVSYDLNRFG